jgi:hypothetical protein
MPRRKMPTAGSANRAWEVINGRHKRCPIEELVKLAEFRVRVPKGVSDDVLIRELKKYDLEIDAEGQQWMVRKSEQRQAIWMELAQFTDPKLRSSETKEEKDVNLTVIIKTFGDQPPPKTLDILTAIPRKLGPPAEDAN